MTVVNGNNLTPSFTVGNGDVLKTQFVAKVGNDYYYRVYAIGTPGQSTGVYTTLPGNAPVKHCAVTIALGAFVDGRRRRVRRCTSCQALCSDNRLI